MQPAQGSRQQALIRCGSPAGVGNFIGAVFEHDQIRFASRQNFSQRRLVPTENATGARAVDAEHVVNNAGSNALSHDAEDANLTGTERANLDSMTRVCRRVKKQMRGFERRRQ